MNKGNYFDHPNFDIGTDEFDKLSNTDDVSEFSIDSSLDNLEVHDINDVDIIEKGNNVSILDKSNVIAELNPEVKANLTYQALVRTGQIYPVYGHEKRILIRKLMRDAKKGKLDKYINYNFNGKENHV